MIYFLVYLFLEVMVSTQIASAIGGFNTFLLILGSAFLGVSILLKFKDTLSENVKAVSQNAISMQEFQRLNLFTLFGAILLIIPGFLSDIIGLLMQFSVVTKMFVNRYGAKEQSENIYNQTQNKNEENVIDVEILDNSTSIKH
ncbi:MAG: FxsA family protein [Helicobacteraceae bacterium]|nr:FxsA family protein [Helicobacteraceae bacterium]